MKENKDTREILKSLVEASPVAIFDLDPAGNVSTIWNPSAEEIFGWTQEEVIGKRLPIVPEAKQEEFDELRSRVLAGESFSGMEVTRQRKDGSPVEVSISTAPMYDEKGDIVGIMSVVDEITERRKAESALRKNERKFREIFNHINDAVYLHELTEDGMPGEFLEVNDIACEMLGYSREEFLSMSPDEIDTGDQSDEVPRIMHEVISEGQKTFRMTHSASDGSKVPVEINARYFEIEGEGRILSVARDMTRQKRVEEQLKQNKEKLETAMEAGNLAWWQMELPSGEVIFSDLKAEMLGYSPAKFETYSDFTDLLHPEDYEDAVSAMKKHLKGRKERYEVEYRIKKSNGNYKWFRDVGRITEEEDEYRQLTGVVIDIDRRKKAELNLQRQRRKLKKLHDAVDRFQQCETETELCHEAVEATQEVLDFEVCTFYCAEEDGLVPVATSRKTEAKELPSQSRDEGLIGETYRNQSSIIGDDLRTKEKAEASRNDLKGFMSVPIGNVGVFQIASTVQGAFDKDDLELAEILAGHLHEEVKRIRLEVELKEQAIRDPLTNLYNRRYFNETLSKEIERGQRYGHQIAFLMIDVNRFKEINDRYSHQTGDEVLREVGRLLLENVRSADTVIRYGGDEFLVMMPETNGGVEKTVTRLNKELYRWNETSDLLDFPLTLAMGVSHWSPDQDRDAEAALKQADKKMYEDKEGRD
ncbi:PAS domain S-box protein [Candidatus Bipolaricaulota bacterium]|nr:PAS domain S-box protein [Candidatus Bipolaricaulota bacterium]